MPDPSQSETVWFSRLLGMRESAECPGTLLPLPGTDTGTSPRRSGETTDKVKDNVTMGMYVTGENPTTFGARRL